jgi:hypothetical protein
MTDVDTQGFTRMVRPMKQKWERNSITRSIFDPEPRSMLEAISCFSINTDSTAAHEATYRHCGKDPP